MSNNTSRTKMQGLDAWRNKSSLNNLPAFPLYHQTTFIGYNGYIILKVCWLIFFSSQNALHWQLYWFLVFILIYLKMLNMYCIICFITTCGFLGPILYLHCKWCIQLLFDECYFSYLIILVRLAQTHNFKKKMTSVTHKSDCK